MKNIELFDEFVARILAGLYEHFPVKSGIDARVLSGHMETDQFGGILDERGEPSRKFEIALATIDWLVDTGYIRTGERRDWGYPQAVLTASGLEVLKASPESLKAREAIGDRIVRLVKDGSLGLAKEAAKAAISTGIGMIR
jgi:hypothetical protein